MNHTQQLASARNESTAIEERLKKYSHFLAQDFSNLVPILTVDIEARESALEIDPQSAPRNRAGMGGYKGAPLTGLGIKGGVRKRVVVWSLGVRPRGISLRLG